MHLTTSGLETEPGYSHRKRLRNVNKKGKYEQEKKEASYKKQKEARDKRKKTHNPYSAKIYNVF